MQKLELSDRSRIRTLLELTGVFNLEEVQCALSLFDIYCEKGPDPDEYVFLGAYDVTDTVLGFVTYGRASLTDRVYDLYWIATDPLYQRQGIGTHLMEFLNGEMKKVGARMILAETSSRVEYEKTRQFYVKQGFCQVAVIRDYYARQDDLMIFQKNYPGAS